MGQPRCTALEMYPLVAQNAEKNPVSRGLLLQARFVVRTAAVLAVEVLPGGANCVDMGRSLPGGDPMDEAEELIDDGE